MNQEQQYMFDDSLMLHVREFAALQCHLDLHRIFLIYDAKRWKETTGSGKRANAMNDEKKLTLKKKCRGKQQYLMMKIPLIVEMMSRYHNVVPNPNHILYIY